MYGALALWAGVESLGVSIGTIVYGFVKPRAEESVRLRLGNPAGILPASHNMITVIIPCYNAAPYIEQAIESVLAQTRRADEIIVVDDCSRDESMAVAERYPVRVLRTRVNSGHATARNIGIRAAQGDVIAWLDADDYWEADHLEVVSDLLERFPAVALAFSKIRMCGTRNGAWGYRGCDGEPKKVFWDCFRSTVVPAMAVLTRKSAVVEVGGFNESVRFAPDFDLWLRLSRRYAFVSVDQVTSNYRQHDTQISRTPMKQ